MRPKDKSDPDPKLSTVLLHIWPLMLVVTLASLYLLVLIAGLIGIYIFPALLLCFCLSFGTMKYFCKEYKVKGKVEQDPEDVSAETDDDQNKEVTKSATERETQSFVALAALCSMYLPSVVGHQERRIFLVSGMTSLASKILLLVFAVTLAALGLQPHIHKRPFLLFCVERNSSLLFQDDIRPCSISEKNCLPVRNMTQEERFVTALNTLKNALEEFDYAIDTIDDAVAAEKREDRDFFPKNLTNTLPFLGNIEGLRSEYEKKLSFLGIGKAHQKIRICEEDETPLRLCILVSLLLIVAMATCATYRLHRLADYKVHQN